MMDDTVTAANYAMIGILIAVLVVSVWLVLSGRKV
jgi:Flp pilus assembly pilin Flp